MIYAYNVDIMAEILGGFEQAVLLALVKLGADAYGRTILREVAARLKREVAAGAVYATLDRLEAKGLISSRLDSGTPVRAGRARRYYRLTADGIRALNESKAVLENLWRGADWPVGGRA
jgi:PadR family transcriptional regulator PadR